MVVQRGAVGDRGDDEDATTATHGRRLVRKGEGQMGLGFQAPWEEGAGLIGEVVTGEGRRMAATAMAGAVASPTRPCFPAPLFTGGRGRADACHGTGHHRVGHPAALLGDHLAYKTGTHFPWCLEP